MIPATIDLRPLVAGPGRLARTLAADRYLDLPGPDDKSEDSAWRTSSCDRICSGLTRSEAKLPAWHGPEGFLDALRLTGKPCVFLRATQTSRLLVNLGGTALENGGLSLDRLSGLPTIPGSAVKGIARREAMLTLQTADLEERPAWLANIAEDFGWGPEDWTETGDFAAACGANWTTTRDAARSLLAETFRCVVEKLPAAYRGRASFLPGFPERNAPIVKDVITCHHPHYYAASGSEAVALDNEDPRPIVFPAIEKGSTWVFAVVGLDHGSNDRCDEAARFLAAGLRQGIGAKTAAGYGRFSPLGEFAAEESVQPCDQVILTFVTPCMCAGADQRIAELRVASLRGELRWWFRALGGTKEQETEVFGGIWAKPKSSALLLEISSEKLVHTPWIVEVRRDQNGRSIKFLQDINTAPGYLWHYAAVAGADGQAENRLWLSGRKGGQPNPNATLSPGTAFTLRRSWRRSLPDSSRHVFDRAWRAFLCFGAIGLRANRAMGCWMPSGAKVGYAEVISDLKKSGFRVTVSDREFPDWKGAVTYLGTWMKNANCNRPWEVPIPDKAARSDSAS